MKAQKHFILKIVGRNILIQLYTCTTPLIFTYNYYMHLQPVNIPSSNPNTTNPSAYQIQLPHKNTFFSQNQSIKKEELVQNQIDLLSGEAQKKFHYFLTFFSPKETAESLKRRNDNLESINFEDPNLQPDQIYNRRKRKVQELLRKERSQIQQILTIRDNSVTKFNAISEFIKIFCDVKQSILSIKTDYYSNKTFFALKNATEQDLTLATKAVLNIYQKTVGIFVPNLEAINNQENLKARMVCVEFLIIPRFLISKEKINKFSRDEELQQNFQFMILNQCLGNYNNEANKKMPDNRKMTFVKQLMSKKDGHEKFKKICSINHGNHFLRNHGIIYYELYGKSLQYLKFLDSELKKGKKYSDIKKQLESFKAETEDTIRCEGLENDSSSNSSGFFSFKSFSECLKNLDKQKEEGEMEEQRDKKEGSIFSKNSKSMKKNAIKRLASLPDKDQEQKPNPQREREFKVKKSATQDSKKTMNIILIAPKKYEQEQA